MATPARASYDRFADWYDEWLGDGAGLGSDPFALPLLELVGPVAGQRVCDLACGQGRTSRHLAAAGATVVGVDVSSRMLEIAGTYPSPASLSYRHDDAHTLSTCDDAEFDGVLCNMALMDIEDLEATFASVARVLRPGGWFGFSVFHPCFNTPLSGEWWTTRVAPTARSPATSPRATGGRTCATARRARSGPTTAPWPPSSTVWPGAGSTWPRWPRSRRRQAPGGRCPP
ncbi:class I SAM-dependent DNA methyltransferase [Desertihabitans aurantiacus]|uniref:class I SAM-dependent DNA methyltransferase n=1 Tax=Desertihabitans aurantiacus TaxID=2282477 RepID=UPI000DF7FF7D|nr:class I SAM-dependent methyltransferase [Desertihabitans aurantiacus]